MPLRMLIVLLWVLWYGRKADLIYVNGLELPGVLGSRLLRKPAALKVVVTSPGNMPSGMDGPTTASTISDCEIRAQGRAGP